MSKTITDEKIKLTIEINGNAAQKDLIDLEKVTRKLTEETKDLTLERKRLEQQGKKDTAEYKALTAAINANNKVITENKQKMKVLQDQIGITGLTLSQLRQKATILRATLSNMIPGTEDFRRYQAELTQVNNRIGELTGRAAQARFSLSSLADSFNRYQALALSVVAAITGIVLSVQKIIDINGKLSDAQSDVMKTTGMTKDEVNELTKSFGALKTRTARIELLGLATEAGRLGIEGVANVQAFVEQANKMKVALGDDLSDEAIREVGKMVNVYRVGEQTGRDFAGSMDALGSSINEVSASGANQAGYLVDYLKRQAGIAAQAKLSAADNIGYAATFDEIGQSVEVSATAMNKVWMDMFQNPSQFAKIAGMSIKDFNQLLATDSNEAMLKFLEGLRGNDAGLQQMMVSLEDLEVGGARGVSALSALANNTELLRKRQITSNQALIESTSLTNEYDIKNNNLAATLEKLQKTIVGMFSSEGFVNWLSGAVDWIAKFVGATEDAEGSATNWRNGIVITAKVLAVLAAALITNIAWQKLVFLWTTRNTQATWLYNLGVKARAIAEGASIVVTQAYAAMTMLLRGNIIGATQALRVMTVTMLTTPWGLLLAGIAAVTAAYFLFSDSTDKASLSAKTFAKIQSEVASGVKAEKENLESLVALAKDETLSKEAKLKIIKQINEISPEYLGNITLENIKTDATTAAINRYVAALNNKLELEAIDNALRESKQRSLEKEQAGLEEYSKWYDGLFNSMLGNTAGSFSDQVTSAMKRQTTDIGNETELQKDLLEKRKDLMKKMFSEVGPTTPDGSPPPPAGETEDAKKKREEAARKAKEVADKRIEELKKSAEERLRIERELEDAILANMDESYQKEWQLEQTNWTRKIQDLQNRIVKESEIELALKKSKNQNLSKEERDFWGKQAQSWIANNKHVQGIIEMQEQAHKIRLATIQEKAANKEIGTLQDKHNREKVIRETNFNNSLAELTLTEDQKAQAKKDFQLKELEEEEKHLRNLLESYKTIIGGEKFNGIDLSLLTPEQVEEFKKLAEDVGLKLSEMKDKKDAISGKSGPTNAEALGLGGGTDIFGFTPDNWVQLFDNLTKGKVGVEEMAFAVQALSNMWSQYSQFLQANEAAKIRQWEVNTDRRKVTLKRQLDSGLISQTQYNRAVETLETDLDRKKAKIEYDQAKRQKAISIANIISQTAQSIIGLWANPGYPMAIPLTALVAGVGALQLATVMKTPLPAKGYEDGYYPVKREQDGKMFNATMGGRPTTQMVRKPKVFLAGENGENFPEMIIDGRSFARFSPELKAALDRELRGVKGFEQGYYSKETGRYEVPVQPSGDSQMMQMVMSLMAENIELLRGLRANGLTAKVLANDYKSMENLEDGIKNLNELKTKNRR